MSDTSKGDQLVLAAQELTSTRLLALLGESLEDVSDRDVFLAFQLAAEHDHADALPLFQPRPGLPYGDAMIQALVNHRTASIAWLAPRIRASEVWDDMMANYDDTHSLDYEEAMGVLDQAGPYLSQSARTYWLNEVGRGSGLLPDTLIHAEAHERAMARQAQLKAQSPVSSSRSRRRS